jgi:hypothetical protein
MVKNIFESTLKKLKVHSIFNKNYSCKIERRNQLTALPEAS